MNKDCENTVTSFVNKMETDCDYMLVRLSALHKILLTINKCYVGIHINVDDFPIWKDCSLEKLIKDLEHCGYSITDVDETGFDVNWCDFMLMNYNIPIEGVLEENKDEWNYEDSD